MLLSHTAGFTRETPVGNDELDPGDFEAHARSAHRPSLIAS
jgi:hypothetical protein